MLSVLNVVRTSVGLVSPSIFVYTTWLHNMRFLHVFDSIRVQIFNDIFGLGFVPLSRNLPPVGLWLIHHTWISLDEVDVSDANKGVKFDEEKSPQAIRGSLCFHSQLTWVAQTLGHFLFFLIPFGSLGKNFYTKVNQPNINGIRMQLTQILTQIDKYSHQRSISGTAFRLLVG